MRRSMQSQSRRDQLLDHHLLQHRNRRVHHLPAHHHGFQASDEAEAKARCSRNLRPGFLRRYCQQYVPVRFEMNWNQTNILPVVRAYYSHRNETMLTCTVSMIETAIAIIATCLPALRSMILGTNNTTKDSANSYGRHYELSSARRKASGNRLTASNQISGGLHSTHDTRNRANGSEDSLFTDPPSDQIGGVEQFVSGKGITVNTQIETMFEDSSSRSNISSSSTKAKSPFN